MTREQRFLLNSLADFCNGRTTAKPVNPVDFKKLYQEAAGQNLEGLLYGQYKKWLLQTNEQKAFHQALLDHVFLSANRADLLREIADRFRKAGIFFICMKGAVFRNYYPIPELRSMGDIDIIIRPEDREASDRILREDMGLQRIIDNHAVWTYWTGMFVFEVHDHMFYEHLVNQFDYQAYFDSVWDHTRKEAVFGFSSENMSIPDENFHFLYLMAHTAKHVINNGSGFRAYLDMVTICSAKGSEMNWDQIRCELEKMGLLEFTKTCFSLCESWFGVQMPLGTVKLENNFYQMITEKSFTDGVFGLHNTENQGAKAAKEITHTGKPYLTSSLKLTIQKIFPPYRDMQLIPWYAWVDGKPWLLPAAWIYRWGYCLVNKRKHTADLLTEPFAKRSEIEKRQELIRNWGL